eukprot:1236298-Rhodomonas_salina.2
MINFPLRTRETAINCTASYSCLRARGHVLTSPPPTCARPRAGAGPGHVPTRCGHVVTSTRCGHARRRCGHVLTRPAPTCAG